MTERFGVGYINDQQLNRDAEGNFTLLLSKDAPDINAYVITVCRRIGFRFQRCLRHFGSTIYADRSLSEEATLAIEIWARNLLTPPSDQAIADV